MTDVQWETLRPILQDLTDRIARIEQFLAASGLQAPAQPDQAADGVPTSFGTPEGTSRGQFVAYAHGVDMGGDPTLQSTGIPDYIAVMAKTGNSIRAIKELRDTTGMGLREAKAAIDQITRGR